MATQIGEASKDENGNFAAGMTGGVAYVLDEEGDFDLRCNLATVDLEPVCAGSVEESELLELLRRHERETGSQKAARILARWPEFRGRFVCVMPVEYKKILRGEGER